MATGSILTNIEVHRRSTMTTCTLVPTVSISRSRRVVEWIARYFSQSVVSREAIDHTWIDSGLGRLGRATLEDIGAPPAAVERAARNEAWQLASALDATRLL
jgi:hypothetical protein